MRTILVGLGNPILSDDSVGIKIVGLVKQRIPEHAGVDAVEAYAGGLRLMEAIAGYDRAIIVDAMKTGIHPPGTMQMLSLDSFTKTRNTLCTHDGDLATALSLGRDLGLAIPGLVEIIGIEADDVESFSEELTNGVSRALPLVVSYLVRRCGF
ncbi:hydrogenase 2 maturation protease [Geobacter sp. OR-1]|uniref:hydrogenase maturation protease n=1 Tax=Geobacter sp. OR-1 TaxID=1266765 RepID=UPI000543DBAA|nr:hydrogenase maturation protease [Geobacter sp. OR-1]GAM09089.1 hydrogenase 2 maturation protease [Geobacter sp. OR-1]